MRLREGLTAVCWRRRGESGPLFLPRRAWGRRPGVAASVENPRLSWHGSDNHADRQQLWLLRVLELTTQPWGRRVPGASETAARCPVLMAGSTAPRPAGWPWSGLAGVHIPDFRRPLAEKRDRARSTLSRPAGALRPHFAVFPLAVWKNADLFLRKLSWPGIPVTDGPSFRPQEA